MAKISEFVGLVRDGGLAVPSHFTVVLNLPERLLFSPYVEKKKKIITFCDKTQLPGLSFTSSQVRSYGEFKEVPYEKIYEPITLSFYIDNDMVIKNLFDDWMDLVQSKNTRDFNWPSEYLSDSITIYVEDAEGQTNYTVSLHDCYPKSIAPIELDYASKDIMRMNVTISYKYFMFDRISNYSLNQIQYEEDTYNQFTYGQDLRKISAISKDLNIGNFSRVDSTIDGARSIISGIDKMRDVFA